MGFYKKPDGRNAAKAPLIPKRSLPPLLGAVRQKACNAGSVRLRRQSTPEGKRRFERALHY